MHFVIIIFLRWQIDQSPKRIFICNDCNKYYADDYDDSNRYDNNEDDNEYGNVDDVDIVDDDDDFDDACRTFFIKVVSTVAWLRLPQPFCNPDTPKFVSYDDKDDDSIVNEIVQ